MSNPRKNPRILMVTPEITYLPETMCPVSLKAKVGGLADVTSALVQNLSEQGIDVHLAIPNYRHIFRSQLSVSQQSVFDRFQTEKSPENRVHLAEDRVFYYDWEVYARDWHENARRAMIFQREVVNNIIPRVQPDIIHCNDWTTGLLPAAVRKMGIPCLFTIHNIHTYKATLGFIEYMGMDAASFWHYLYYQRPPYNYEETRDSNPVDFLTSGIYAAHFVNTVGPTFLNEVADGKHSFVDYSIQTELRHKRAADCATGILNAPDPVFNPSTDKILPYRYGVSDHAEGKRQNKLYLQQLLGLKQDADAPVFFWPSRLDPIQKGCQLLADILYRIISEYWEQNLQMVFVANGEYQHIFRNIVRFHRIEDRVVVRDFSEYLEHLSYAASDFVLMPSKFEPCGLPQMIAPIYGSLPVAHDTGGIHDTIDHLDAANNSGNGFLFKTFDANGLFWAIRQAMRFYNLPQHIKAAQVDRIMAESAARFTHSATARNYIDLYEKMLARPLIT
jgi:starch synthase/alpha-amylase